MSSKAGGGRYAVMRDLQDHLIAGRINYFDLGIYTAIHWQVDFRTGIWWGSAPKLHSTGPSGFSLRYVQRSLEKLTQIGFLKPFRRHGQRGNCAYLINKYEPLSGAHKGQRLNAASSTAWQTPVWEICAVRDGQDDTVHDAERCSERTPIHKALSINHKNQPSPSAPLVEGFESFWNIFPRKEGKKNAQKAWAKIPAAERPAVIAALEHFKLTEQWQKDGGRFIPHPSTFLDGRRWEDELPTPRSQTLIGKNGRVPHIPTAADCRPEH